MAKQKVLKLARHRNGSIGEPFKVAIVDDPDCGKMVVIRFEDDEDSGVRCAALNIQRLSEGIIEAGLNSYKGSYFSGVVDRSRKK